MSAQRRRAPLSFGQERVWIAHQLRPGDTSHNVTRVIHMHGVVDVPAMRHAFDEVLRRHEVLRTTVAGEDGVPVQIVGPPVRGALSLVDLRALDPAVRQTQAHRAVDRCAWTAFDLESGPLVRAILFLLGPAESILVITIHHIVTDGWSMHLLAGEMSDLYAAFTRGLPSPLAEPALQYTDWAAAQRDGLRDGKYDEQMRFWKRELASARPLHIARARLHPAAPGDSGRVPVSIPPALTDALKEAAARHKVTLYTLLLGAFMTTMRAFTGCDDALVETPAAGRSLTATETAIGYFAEHLVLTAPAQGAVEFPDLLRHLRRQVSDALSRQDVPVSDILDAALRRAPVPADHQVFSGGFALQNAGRETWDFPSIRVEREAMERNRWLCDLGIVLVETADGLRGKVRYNLELFDAGTMRRFTSEFERVLAALAGAGAVQRPRFEPVGGVLHTAG